MSEVPLYRRRQNVAASRVLGGALFLISEVPLYRRRQNAAASKPGTHTPSAHAPRPSSRILPVDHHTVDHHRSLGIGLR
jgi:hypothetical protein